MTDRAGRGHDREENAGHHGDVAVGHANLLDVQRQHRAEAAVDELEAEDHGHHQDEVLECQHVLERHAPARCIIVSRPVRVDRVFVVEPEHDDEPHRVEERCADERATQADQPGERAADHRADARPQTLRRLHETDRLGHPIARRRFRRHGDRERSVAGEESLHRAQREHVPRARHERHRRHQHDEADERSLDHDLAPIAITQAAPGRRQDRRQSRRHPKADAGPHRDLADVGDAELADEKRKKRHHEREARVTEKRRRRHCVYVAAPAGAWRWVAWC